MILINGRFMTQPVTGVQRFARELIAELGRQMPDTVRFILVLPGDNVIHPLEGIETYRDNSPLPSLFWQQVRLPVLMNDTRRCHLCGP
jgi:hypothetical protein